mgnify:CR=1 FL=1|tara:strand:+ start:45058 stop:47550 length:2493 start_codon:yes stop_codon:yes gene_type:complete
MAPITRKSFYLVLLLTALIPLMWLITSDQRVSAQSQIPNPPMFLEGSVTVVGSPVVDGAIVSARTIVGGSVITGSIGTCGTKNGKYGSYACTDTGLQHLRVASDDPNTRAVDGGRNGDTVQILIGGSIAATTTFASGTVAVVNLTRSTALPTATPTPGATATPASGGGGGGGAIGTVPTSDDLKEKTASEAATDLEGLPADIVTDILKDVLVDSGESKGADILGALIKTTDNQEVVADILVNLAIDTSGTEQAGRLIVSMAEDADSTEGIANALTLMTKSLEGQARVGSMLQDALGTSSAQTNIAKVFDLLAEDSDGQQKVAEIFRVIAGSAEGAKGGGGVIGNMASTTAGVERAAGVLAVLAADDDGAKLAGALIDGTIAVSGGISKASNVLESMDIKVASSVMESVTVSSRISIAETMPVASLADRLQEVVPAALFADGMSTVLLERLVAYPVEQLVAEEPPTVDPSIPGPESLGTVGNLSQYKASKTSSTDWTKVVGSPAPIDSVLGKFKSSLSNVKINLEILSRAPSGSNSLPDDQSAYKYFSIGVDGANASDIENGHITFYIPDDWFSSGSYVKWSVFLYRLNDDTGDWVAFPTKRIKENDGNVYYTATVPGFSSFAIGGGTSVPSPKFIVSDLKLNPDSPGSNQEVSVSARVTNTSGINASYTGTIWVNKQANGTVLASVGAGESKVINFGSISKPEGLYEVRVGRQIKALNVGGTSVPLPSATKAPSKATPIVSVPSKPEEVKPTAVPAAPEPTTAPTVPEATAVPAAPEPTTVPEPTTAPEATIVPEQIEDGGSNMMVIVIIAIVAIAAIGGVAVLATRRRS